MSYDKDTAVSVLYSIAAAGNIILFLAQTPMIVQLIKEKDATKYTWLPSLTLMSTLSLWSGYTVFVYPDPRARADIYIGNFSGVAIPLVNLIIFVIYSKTWAARARIIGATVLALAATWGFSLGVFLTLPLDVATNISGGVTAAVNSTFFLSPLKAIWESILSLDASRVPVTLSIVQVFQALPWVVGAAILGDPFILGVNAAGHVMALLQLAGVGYVRWKRVQMGLPPAVPQSKPGAVVPSPRAGDEDDVGAKAPLAGDAASGSASSVVAAVEEGASPKGDSVPLVDSASSTPAAEASASASASGATA